MPTYVSLSLQPKRTYTQVLISQLAGSSYILRIYSSITKAER